MTDAQAKDMRTAKLNALRALTFSVAVVGCGVRGGKGHLVAGPPAPGGPQPAYLEWRPGPYAYYGQFDYLGGQWLWVDRMWIAERQGFEAYPGAWVPIDENFVWDWNEGRWEKRDKTPGRDQPVLVPVNEPVPPPKPPAMPNQQR